ncbi:dipeptide/oligopeptide/nickel ABC transporter permease/ATP-binding protein [Microbacterium sp. W4I20]|uniref:dipeptide/oligopeptide/nickel ABC transporter permease/ATP-binding protein n=1 Tax=Microbacterium sp. W4I20 TaxID=3042262 RepID=UPI0027811D3E|nr:dipeptide/oligopeptide/nickel ABC transporter permease/ATP-binding protein [Microbacterium sp. W4I20]MDQ0727822.1 peptide/nickel transport system permease protein [Microbacterium sp. W4I20]
MTTPLTATLAAPTPPVKKGQGRNLDWLRGLRSAKIIVGGTVFLLFVLVAIFGPMLVTTDPSAVSTEVLLPPSPEHWLGTTHTGQDLFAQMVYGTRISLFVGVVSAFFATALSLIVGLTAGYVGGIGDELLSVLSNIFLVIPGLPLVVILAGYLPSTGSIGIIIVISITGWAWGARVLRAQTLSLRNRDFVEAARVAGDRTFRIIWSEILPNMLAIVASSFLATVTGGILTQAGLAFLGMTDVTEWSWGGILYWAQNSSALLFGAWWWFVPPGLAIAVIGTALALVNFGIDEFVNPRLRSAGLGTKAGTKTQFKRPRQPVLNLRKPRRDLDESTDFVAGEAVLHISHLSVEYQTHDGGAFRAVDDVSLTLHRGEIVGLAGESGSGKTTLAYAVTRLLRPPAVIAGGDIVYTGRDGEQIDVLALDDRELKAFRWSEIAMVLQSAMNALNPVISIGDQIEDIFIDHDLRLSREERHRRAAELLRTVGIDPIRLASYPHQLSGGMRQRVMIAMALSLKPRVIIMDEPTTALDVIVQRSIIDEIARLRHDFGFAVLFITHDLGLLLEISDRVGVMRKGRLVEQNTPAELLENAEHDYTRHLLKSFPSLRGDAPLSGGGRYAASDGAADDPSADGAADEEVGAR